MQIGLKSYKVRFRSEVCEDAGRIRTGVNGFADRRQTTWLPPHISGEIRTFKCGIRSPMPFPFGDGDVLPEGIEPSARGS